MKATLSSRLHLATWCLACLLTLVPIFGGKPVEQATGSIIAMLFWMAVYYLFFLYIAPELLLRKKLIAFFGISIAILFLLPFIGYSLLYLSRALFRGDFTHFYEGYSIPTHFSGFKAMALAGVYGSFFRLLVAYFNE